MKNKSTIETAYFVVDIFGIKLVEESIKDFPNTLEEMEDFTDYIKKFPNSDRLMLLMSLANVTSFLKLMIDFNKKEDSINN